MGEVVDESAWRVPGAGLRPFVSRYSGFRQTVDFGTAIGYGTPPRPDFWIGAAGQVDGFREAHLAFAAPDQAAVRAFFETACGLGAEAVLPVGQGRLRAGRDGSTGRRGAGGHP